MTTLAESSRMQNGNTEHAPVDSDFERLLNRPLVVRKPSEVLAETLGIPQEVLSKAIKAMMPSESSEADFLAFMHIAAKYRLNPFIKEIYPFFSKKTGKMHTIVGIDGWASIVLRDKRFDGVGFEYIADENGNPEMIWCTMHVKGLSHPVRVPERFAECVRDTEQWRGLPWRMLRHRAYIQAARLAFGVHGIESEFDISDLGTMGDIQLATFENTVKESKAKKANPFREPPPEATSPPKETPGPEGAASQQDATTEAAPLRPAAPVAEKPPAEFVRTPEEIAEELADNTKESDMRAELQRAAGSSDANIKKRYENAKQMAQVADIASDMKPDDLRAVFHNYKLAELKAPAAKGRPGPKK